MRKYNLIILDENKNIVQEKHINNRALLLIEKVLRKIPFTYNERVKIKRLRRRGLIK